MDAETLLHINHAFDPEQLVWRVVELADDEHHARVRPQLDMLAVRARLNTVLTPTGWSYRFDPVNGAISCTLSLGELSRAALVSLNSPVPLDTNTRAHDAFVYAAEGFGILPPADVTAQYWVEFDAEQRTILYEPELLPGLVSGSSPELASLGEASPANEQLVADSKPLTDSKPVVKSEGQQAIDKVMERLNAQGQGLEAAKLAITYNGYGDNPDMAREFYGKLRDLLMAESSS
ncbi:MAG: hypothetical protein AAF267_15230 [Deinococcota bacterium]